MLNVKKEVQETFDPEILRDAFVKFSEASARLEERYDSLAKETEALRAQLQAKDAEVRRHEQLALLGQTAAAVAHEVRNPLGAMKLFTSLLAKDLKDNAGSREIVSEMDRCICSIEHVVSNILQFAKDSPVSLGPVSLKSIVQQAISQFKTEGREGIEFETSFEGREFVLGNEHSLRQVLHNLILNAQQALRGKGRIAVSTVETAEGLELRIRDNGPGIPKGIEDRLFEPFVTSKSEGTGLGLAIVRKIVDQHGGVIRARNNGGAEFAIVFPIHK